MNNWLTEVHDGRRTVNMIARLLSNKAEALRAVGLSDLAFQLSEYAEMLLESNRKIDDAISTMLIDEVQASQQSISETLRVLLSSHPTDEEG